MFARTAICMVNGALILQAAVPATPGWYSIPNTPLNSVCAATNGFPEVRGASGCAAITGAWNSGVFDSKRDRLIIWGGGHNDYYGNELYALSLTGLAMTRLNNPTLPVATGCVDGLTGGVPNSRHTGDGIVYMDHADRMFVQGGVPACPNGGFVNGTWTYDFTASKWERKTPSGPIPSGNGTVLAAYDPVSQKVFVHDANSAFYNYTLETNTYMRLNSNSPVGGCYTKTSVIDPKRRKFFVFGSNEQSVWDISGGAYAKQSFPTSGGSAITGAYCPGLAYDPVRDRIVGWSGGNTVYFLNVDTKTWATETYSGGPGAQETWGTCKRFAFSPASGVLVVYNHTSQNGFTFRSATTFSEARTPMAASRDGFGPGRTFDVLDLRGRKVAGGKTGPVTGLPAGIYFARPAGTGKPAAVKKIAVLR